MKGTSSLVDCLSVMTGMSTTTMEGAMPWSCAGFITGRRRQRKIQLGKTFLPFSFCQDAWILLWAPHYEFNIWKSLLHPPSPSPLADQGEDSHQPQVSTPPHVLAPPRLASSSPPLPPLVVSPRAGQGEDRRQLRASKEKEGEVDGEEAGMLVLEFGFCH